MWRRSDADMIAAPYDGPAWAGKAASWPITAAATRWTGSASVSPLDPLSAPTTWRLGPATELRSRARAAHRRSRPRRQTDPSRLPPTRRERHRAHRRCAVLASESSARTRDDPRPVVQTLRVRPPRSAAATAIACPACRTERLLDNPRHVVPAVLDAPVTCDHMLVHDGRHDTQCLSPNSRSWVRAVGCRCQCLACSRSTIEMSAHVIGCMRSGRPGSGKPASPGVVVVLVSSARACAIAGELVGPIWSCGSRPGASPRAVGLVVHRPELAVGAVASPVCSTLSCAVLMRFCAR
jgi:hypothetical protein